MIFIMHISGLLAFAVLLGSTALIVWSCQNKGKGVCFAKKIGYTIFALTILSMVCIGYYTLKYWSQGEFESSRPMPMVMQKAMMEKMMPHMMPQMMEHMGGMMGNMMGDMDNSGEQTQEDPSVNHH
jgi:hypothetical protein